MTETIALSLFESAQIAVLDMKSIFSLVEFNQPEGCLGHSVGQSLQSTIERCILIYKVSKIYSWVIFILECTLKQNRAMKVFFLSVSVCYFRLKSKIFGPMLVAALNSLHFHLGP